MVNFNPLVIHWRHFLRIIKCMFIIPTIHVLVKSFFTLASDPFQDILVIVHNIRYQYLRRIPTQCPIAQPETHTGMVYHRSYYSLIPLVNTLCSKENATVCTCECKFEKTTYNTMIALYYKFSIAKAIIHG